MPSASSRPQSSRAARALCPIPPRGESAMDWTGRFKPRRVIAEATQKFSRFSESISVSPMLLIYSPARLCQ